MSREESGKSANATNNTLASVNMGQPVGVLERPCVWFSAVASSWRGAANKTAAAYPGSRRQRVAPAVLRGGVYHRAVMPNAPAVRRSLHCRPLLRSPSRLRHLSSPSETVVADVHWHLSDSLLTLPASLISNVLLAMGSRWVNAAVLYYYETFNSGSNFICIASSRISKLKSKRRGRWWCCFLISAQVVVVSRWSDLL